MKSAYSPEPVQRAVAREGYPFLIFLFMVAVFFFILGWLAVVAFCMALFAFVVFFFRNPNRKVPQGDDLIVSPADGRVIAVEELDHAPLIEGPATKVSIFMSVLNVHINRMPVKAVIKEIRYRPGKFLVASLDKASEHNESNTIMMEDEKGRRLAMSQIAGLVARRIVCYVKTGDIRNIGQRLGLIRFGSRVDLYITTPHTLEVSVGNKVKGGSSIIGRWV
jgi:phosphatidylserine decarboxylase